MRRRTLIVMVKEPRAGRVKTRLGREIGMVHAAWWYRRQTTRLLRRLRDPRWDTILAVTPDRDGMLSRVWPCDLRRIPQGSGDLGARMRRALAFTAGPTVLIGSDIPGITRRLVDDAFCGLGAAASLVGPATDGGYWLIGLRHPRRAPASLFRNVRWSSEHALADTLRTLPEPIGRVDFLDDVDTAAT